MHVSMGTYVHGYTAVQLYMHNYTPWAIAGKLFWKDGIPWLVQQGRAEERR